MHSKPVFLLAGAILFATARPAFAQNATLVGLITDPTGAVVLHAAIRAVHQSTNHSREAATDREGQFTIPSLPPGVYDVSVSKDGFRPSRQTGIALQVDQVARLEMALSVGTLAEAVEVSAAAPLVNTDNGVRGEVIGAWEIAEIPLGGRDFSSLAYLVPGVNRQAEGGGPPFPIGGGRPDNTNYQIDGFNNQNPRIGEAQVSPPLNSLQELKVLVNGYSAENGRLAGCAVSTALKSGGNRPHGTLFEYSPAASRHVRSTSRRLLFWDTAWGFSAHCPSIQPSTPLTSPRWAGIWWCGSRPTRCRSDRAFCRRTSIPPRAARSPIITSAPSRGGRT